MRDIPVFDRDIVGTMSRFLDAGSLGSGGPTLVVDGMEARKVGVSPSAILQVKINQDPYAAEFQRPGRGRIEVITKAGSEAYHGSFDFTFRDAQLNARDAFALTRPPEQRRIYEGVLGGPIAGGKHTSFLVTLERRDEDLQSIVFAAGPSGAVDAIVPRPTRGTELSASWTHQAGTKQTYTVRFTGEAQTQRNQGVGGTTLPEAGSNDSSDEEQVVVGHRWIASTRLLSEFRVLIGREVGATASLQPGVRIVVPDAFIAGGAQADQRSSEYHVQLTENVTYLRGRHLLKAGFAIPDWSRRAFDDRTNQAGTFTFASLDDYRVGHPLSFLQQRGDGRIAFLQRVFAGFVQDQITVRPDLTMGLGVRYDWQNIFVDNNNVAPRVSMAYAPGKQTVIRSGIGWFYDRGGDGAIREVLRSRQERLFRYLILDPGYPDPFAGALSGATPPRSTVQLAPGIDMPYTVQYSAGIERQVRKGTTVAVTYIGGRGVDLFRSRDVNAPPPPFYALRPDPTFGTIRQIEGTGRQQTQSLQMSVRGRFAKRLQGTAQYTFGLAHNDTSGINALPANNYDLSGEYGRADFDQRHHLELLAQFNGGAWLKFGAALSAGSGTPYSLRTGTDDFNTGQTTARPVGISRNTLQGPGAATLDLRWSHEIQFGAAGRDERPSIQVGLDAFNVTNHVNFGTPVGNLSSPFFGQSISAQPPRRVQLSLSVTF
jgi:outer membrane receptor protein involved in Fe transport